ncbi:unnamed protein product [Cuscuta europaea]|uniref:Uncharacterized protein n=1 Tax=Cuscuta europaea TaxID=41803 RepID=A0A9P1EHX9_CUSEU|nr:unnamed protein product [Cuscuta europaea]
MIRRRSSSRRCSEQLLQPPFSLRRSSSPPMFFSGSFFYRQREKGALIYEENIGVLKITSMALVLQKSSKRSFFCSRPDCRSNPAPLSCRPVLCQSSIYIYKSTTFVSAEALLQRGTARRSLAKALLRREGRGEEVSAEALLHMGLGNFAP